jgi:hypothetical protein
MDEEVHRSPAAEISVTSNGDLEESHEDVFRVKAGKSIPFGTALTHHTTHNYMHALLLKTEFAHEFFLFGREPHYCEIITRTE